VVIVVAAAVSQASYAHTFDLFVAVTTLYGE
jgi:hypothetical protein